MGAGCKVNSKTRDSMAIAQWRAQLDYGHVMKSYITRELCLARSI